MAKRVKPEKKRGGPTARQGAALQEILDGLASPDDQTRAAAVRELCPCRSAFDVPVQRYVSPMENDPSSSVRHEARHVLYEDGTWGKKLEHQRVKREIEEGLASGEYVGAHSLGWKTRKKPLVQRGYYPPLQRKRAVVKK